MDAKIVAMRREVEALTHDVFCPYCEDYDKAEKFVNCAELSKSDFVGICPSCGGELLYEDFYDD